MLHRTFLTACILCVSAVSASAQLVAVPVPIPLPDQTVAVVPQANPPQAIPPAQQAVGEVATPVAITPQPVMAQPGFYTPTYYYYYYQPPYHVQSVQMAAPVIPLQPVIPRFGVTPAYYGTFINGRGEPGHVRYPYYSYRRPWYFPGQPGIRTTIPGQVW
ncbi:MAG: hypothetical protein VB858_01655 [Planctomycetaceae bacterium]